MNDITLKEFISNLPNNLRNKIYVLCMKEFWKGYVPLTAKIPSWYNHKIEIEKEIFESKQNNIHFMHLSFNTLPQNKTWIMGCQCQDCLSENLLTIEEKEFFYSIQNIYDDVYDLDFPQNKGLTGNFNPLCNTRYDTSIRKRINGLQIEFL